MPKPERVVCEWCGKPFNRPSPRGTKPRYCSAAHRQRALEARQHDDLVSQAKHGQIGKSVIRRLLRDGVLVHQGNELVAGKGTMSLRPQELKYLSLKPVGRPSSGTATKAKPGLDAAAMRAREKYGPPVAVVPQGFPPELVDLLNKQSALSRERVLVIEVGGWVSWQDHRGAFEVLAIRQDSGGRYAEIRRQAKPLDPGARRTMHSVRLDQLTPRAAPKVNHTTKKG